MAMSLGGEGGSTTEVKCPSHHIISRLHTINMIYDVDVDLDYLPEVVFVKILHHKVTFPLPFPVIFLERKSLYAAHN